MDDSEKAMVYHGHPEAGAVSQEFHISSITEYYMKRTPRNKIAKNYTIFFTVYEL